MLYEAAQVAAEAAKASTGKLVLDGAMLIAGFKVVEAGLRWGGRLLLPKNGNGKLKPGEGKLCGEHTTELAVQGTKLSTIEKILDEIKDDIKEIRGAVVK